jgi:tRNA pseudouridine13 synthase
MLPLDPPLATQDLPGTGGAIGPNPEDFVVGEMPLYPASGRGEHRYVLVQKRGRSTPEMLREIARAANVPERDVGYAGLKDKHAVTTQWLSVPAKSEDPANWRLPPSISVLSSTFHDNKLRTGHLAGNRFEIRLEGCDREAFDKARSIASRLSARGLVNFFGAQRFGQRGENLDRALEWLRQSRGARKRAGRFLSKLYPSVLQAELFNRYAVLRAELGLEALIPGEVVRLEGSGAMFRVEAPALEAPRFSSGDLHLTGPILGPRTRPAAARALELERSAQAELGLGQADLETLGREAPGSRRDLLVRIPDLEISETDPGCLRLTFTLPAGSYATQLVREFTRSPFVSDETRPPEYTRAHERD